jgi:hypothetical protein
VRLELNLSVSNEPGVGQRSWRRQSKQAKFDGSAISSVCCVADTGIGIQDIQEIQVRAVAAGPSCGGRGASKLGMKFGSKLAGEMRAFGSFGRRQ